MTALQGSSMLLEYSQDSVGFSLSIHIPYLQAHTLVALV